MNYQDKPAEFFLTWFSADEDDLIGEEKISDLTQEQAREWFWLLDDDFVDCCVVTASQRVNIQQLVKHEIDLNKYDYFVEYTIVLAKESNEKCEIGRAHV